MKYFEYKHTVLFEETNVVGNVYFANFIKWQGACREMFLKKTVPEIVEEVNNGELLLITLHTSCDYISQLVAFDDVVLGMTLDKMNQNRIKMLFNYYKEETDGSRKMIAKGVHEIGCYRKSNGMIRPSEIPENLYRILSMN